MKTYGSHGTKENWEAKQWIGANIFKGCIRYSICSSKLLALKILAVLLAYNGGVAVASWLVCSTPDRAVLI